MKSKPKYDIFRIVTTSFCLLLVLLVVIFAVNTYNDIKGKSGSTKDVEVTIPLGSNASEIAGILKKSGIISSSLSYKTYTAFYKDLPDYQYGKFLLNSRMSFDEIAKRLQEPSEFALTKSFTFPEGTTVLKMAMMMADGGMEFTVNDFMEACNEDYSKDCSFFSLIESRDNKFCKLEGYLFPSQYEFYYYDSPHTVIAKMLAAFEENVYTETVKTAVANGLSLENTIILASIVEKESPDDETVRAQIASVFLNRLADGSPVKMLQTDTSRAGTGYPDGVIQYYYDEYAKKSAPDKMLAAYDTYSSVGLTPGAICNPGVKSINSVISPAKTDYYYFVSAEDGTTYFARTLAEHEANIQKALK